MIRILSFSLLAAGLAAATPAFAREPGSQAPPDEQAMMAAYQKAGAPGPEHARLAKMAGSYDFVVRTWQTPGAPPTTDTGTAVRRMTLGGRVMVEETSAQMMGQPFSGVGMHGYDNVSGKHWATWNDSMSTGVMLSEGTCDAQGACTYTGSWNDPITKGRVTARMTSRWTGTDTEVFEMHGPAPDGKEMKMMEITYTRRADAAN
ncbi:MAG TPA: DUF1579 domain-containing protein [Pseudoxanthomonas sp.]|nr:DUF1579 domain-containing protein [Pseudoxanthomonas sp.]